jgi:predicted alpha-1,6-mannanase (GH76 family)
MTTGQVCDGISANGIKNCLKFTYNEGLMIGACVSLFQVTSDTEFLKKAQFILEFMMKEEVAPSENYGNVLSDDKSRVCTGDCMEFKGIAFRYLSLLYEVMPSDSVS